MHGLDQYDGQVSPLAWHQDSVTIGNLQVLGLFCAVLAGVSSSAYLRGGRVVSSYMLSLSELCFSDYELVDSTLARHQDSATLK